jgi:hypothetical protein
MSHSTAPDDANVDAVISADDTLASRQCVSAAGFEATRHRSNG